MFKKTRIAYSEKIACGFERMKSLRVGICATARDCELQLKRIIPMIEQLREAFAESHVVIVENDSVDHTKDVLQQWAASSSNVHILSEVTNTQTILNSSKDVSNPFFSLHRIEKMAKYRNKYLEFIEKQNLNLDYLIIMDVDIYEIAHKGIAHSFGQTIDWDMISSNGLMPRALKRFYRGYLYYDGYALRGYGDTKALSKDTAFYNQYQYSDLKPEMPLLHVASAFNGLAIYKWEAIQSLRYHCEPNDDEEIKAMCEHINLHRQMAERGYDKIYINPAQIIYYDRYSNLLRQSLGLNKKQP